jgi:hypothetical protein
MTHITPQPFDVRQCINHQKVVNNDIIVKDIRIADNILYLWIILGNLFTKLYPMGQFIQGWFMQEGYVKLDRSSRGCWRVLRMVLVGSQCGYDIPCFDISFSFIEFMTHYYLSNSL